MALKLFTLARTIHKWTSIGIGIFLLVWLVSGMFSIMPVSILERIDRWVTGGQQVRSAEMRSERVHVGSMAKKPDYRNVSLSVPEAISVLETDVGHAVQVTGCSIYRLSGTLVYDMTIEDGRRYLIDAIEGVPTTVTEAQIKKSAKAAAPPGSHIVDMTYLTKRPYAYWGPIPIYRLIFNDTSRTHVYVSPFTGQVKLKNRGWNRLAGWMLSLHKFEFLLLIWEREAFRKGIMLVLSLVGLGVVATGFYIALPVKWLRRLPWNQKK
jgi:uncharacterized iron-regulated membrane protein